MFFLVYNFPVNIKPFIFAQGEGPPLLSHHATTVAQEGQTSKEHVLHVLFYAISCFCKCQYKSRRKHRKHNKEAELRNNWNQCFLVLVYKFDNPNFKNLRIILIIQNRKSKGVCMLVLGSTILAPDTHRTFQCTLRKGGLGLNELNPTQQTFPHNLICVVWDPLKYVMCHVFQHILGVTYCLPKITAYPVDASFMHFLFTQLNLACM